MAPRRRLGALLITACCEQTLLNKWSVFLLCLDQVLHEELLYANFINPFRPGDALTSITYVQRVEQHPNGKGSGESRTMSTISCCRDMENMEKRYFRFVFVIGYARQRNWGALVVDRDTSEVQRLTRWRANPAMARNKTVRPRSFYAV